MVVRDERKRESSKWHTYTEWRREMQTSYSPTDKTGAQVFVACFAMSRMSLNSRYDTIWNLNFSRTKSKYNGQNRESKNSLAKMIVGLCASATAATKPTTYSIFRQCLNRALKVSQAKPFLCIQFASSLHSPCLPLSLSKVKGTRFMLCAWKEEVERSKLWSHKTLAIGCTHTCHHILHTHSHTETLIDHEQSNHQNSGHTHTYTKFCLLYSHTRNRRFRLLLLM